MYIWRAELALSLGASKLQMRRYGFGFGELGCAVDTFALGFEVQGMGHISAG